MGVKYKYYNGCLYLRILKWERNGKPRIFEFCWMFYLLSFIFKALSQRTASSQRIFHCPFKNDSIQGCEKIINKGFRLVFHWYFYLYTFKALNKYLYFILYCIVTCYIFLCKWQRYGYPKCYSSAHSHNRIDFYFASVLFVHFYLLSCFSLHNKNCIYHP